MKSYFNLREELNNNLPSSDLVAFASIKQGKDLEKIEDLLMGKQPDEESEPITSYAGIRGKDPTESLKEAAAPRASVTLPRVPSMGHLAASYTTKNMRHTLGDEDHLEALTPFRKEHTPHHESVVSAVPHHSALNDEILNHRDVQQRTDLTSGDTDKTVIDRELRKAGIHKKNPARYEAMMNRTWEQSIHGMHVKDYTEHGFNFLNLALASKKKHKGIQLDDHSKEMTKSLDKVTLDKRNASKKKFVVFSGLRGARGRVIHQAKPGRTIHFPTYTSASSNFDVAHRFGRGKSHNYDWFDEDDKGNETYNEHHDVHVVAFHLPKGYSKGRHLHEHSGVHDEHEFLLARNQKYKKVRTEEIKHKPHSGKDEWGDKVNMTSRTLIHHLVPL